MCIENFGRWLSLLQHPIVFLVLYKDTRTCTRQKLPCYHITSYSRYLFFLPTMAHSWYQTWIYLSIDYLYTFVYCGLFITTNRRYTYAFSRVWSTCTKILRCLQSYSHSYFVCLWYLTELLVVPAVMYLVPTTTVPVDIDTYSYTIFYYEYNIHIYV